ncbi:MAG: hypothetical protein DRP64_17340 [Verrucomicrobia bacterium]|nr:MAG: hypothetical protein DRP64_17340 [Verrucomicrobiota bacterium]
MDSATLVRAVAILPDGSRLPKVSRFYTKLQRPATFNTPLKSHLDHVPERAFDGQLQQSYFYSKTPFRDGDHFAILFDTPVLLKSIKAFTGHPDHPDDYVHQGVLQISEDLLDFETVAEFHDGIAETKLDGTKLIKAIVIRATGSQTNGLAVREIVVE